MMRIADILLAMASGLAFLTIYLGLVVSLWPVFNVFASRVTVYLLALSGAIVLFIDLRLFEKDW